MKQGVTHILQKPQQMHSGAAQQGGLGLGPQHAQAGMPGTLVLPQGVLTTSTSQGTMPVTGIAGSMDGTMMVGGNMSLNGASTATVLTSVVDPADLANTKEKTPMCLVNELARYNKVQHQYTLTDEQGPAHKKTFYVKLKLGDEEYAAAGASIKKAQHAAAAIALEKTQHKHPPAKTNRYNNSNINATITPTVELNALAMKRGEPAMYRGMEPQGRHGLYPSQPNYDFRGMYNQRYHSPRYPRIFYVSLKVGQREFIGQGNTRQSARHNAAAKALKVMRMLPLPDGALSCSSLLGDSCCVTKDEMVSTADDAENSGDTGDDKTSAKHGYSSSTDKRSDGQSNDDEDSEDEPDKDKLKSEISLVHEIALKRNMTVTFEVVRESGPPHMRTFITRCTVGEFITDGEGNGKKISKKRAAERMLDQLKALPTLPPTVAKPKRLPSNKKKNRNLIKIQKADPGYGVGINPISRLIQIQQAKKEKEPLYSLVSERGMPRKREFIMQVQVGEHKCTGVGPNKKLAKRSAAEAMLLMLGYSRPSPQPVKPAIKHSDTQSSNEKKVTFVDPNEINSHQTRQLVPGVLLMPDRNHQLNPNYISGLNHPVNSGGVHNKLNYNNQTTAAIAKELLDTGASPTAEGIMKSGSKPGAVTQAVSPKQQLLYLADVLGFQVQFTDFPKGNKTEYLSLVSLSTNPPQVSHGSGTTLEASHDIAAVTALRALVELGIDRVTPINEKKDKDNRMAAGDGPHIKKEITGNGEMITK